MTQPDIAHFDLDGRQIAYRLRPGASPTLVFLPGYASSMERTKAMTFDAYAERRGQALLRFDYSGTGSSGGRFEEGTIALWLEDTLAAIDRLTDGSLIVIGSSMGAWIALHVARLRPERVEAVVGIASAPDFTDWGFSAEQRAQGGIFTPAFLEAGEKMALLNGEIAVDCPVRLLHGDRDTEVPWDISMRTMARLRSADVQLNLIKGGGHRLTEPNEIEAILRTVTALLEPAP
jgi:pimeloyl-ACP methyl ester carboxylesterase